MMYKKYIRKKGVLIHPEISQARKDEEGNYRVRLENPQESNYLGERVVNADFFESKLDKMDSDLLEGTIFGVGLLDMRDRNYGDDLLGGILSRLPEAEDDLEFRYCVICPNGERHYSYFLGMSFILADEKGKPIAKVENKSQRGFDSIILNKYGEVSNNWKIGVICVVGLTCIYPSQSNAMFRTYKNEYGDLCFLDMVGDK